MHLARSHLQSLVHFSGNNNEETLQRQLGILDVQHPDVIQRI